ncbi:hypothetical protein BJP25_21695 [Actinokineospora bangkokensis]|uniref:histidine kinase n=1 Tax=Actinokineospora bangkokensis TaxID=1193682 RepID=A0A1Q9LKS8_9PSEU|nr:hypothetical protein BJP25_21695 [Actinokineospora bangkokensis]
MLVVPALTAAVFGWLRVQAELDNAEGYQRIVDQVDVAQAVTGLVHQLQAERAIVVTHVAAGDAGLAEDPEVRGQFTDTNGAVFEFRRALEGLELADTDKRDRYQLAYDQLRQLDALRNLASGAVYPDLAVLSSYTGLIDPLVQLGREISSDTGPSRVSTAVQTLGQAKERGAQLDALLLIASVRNSFGAASVQNRARSAEAGFEASIADFVAVATPDERQAYNDGYSGPEVDRRRAIAQTALSSVDPNAPLDTDVTALRSTSTAANDKLRGVETDLVSRLRGQAATAADAALAAATRDAVIVLALLVVALALMFYVARTILTPIRTLRREALDVARVRLPETVKRILADPNPVEAAKSAVDPVRVSGGEEIGQLARSFDAVHEQAVRMATEQAVLRDSVNSIFVNLSRRSQALIERQLAELDQLERDEQDPDRLGRFFVLDHLAARMRRNSENLLILSGSGLAKRMARPVPVGEVVESALSEVEHYTRVRVKQVPELVVQGRVVKDLVHLIAELLDNAATFSAPQTQVVVASARVRSGELAIQISDEGMGMSDDELADANERLADPPDFDVSLSRRMGLYVVARLAQRHDIRVRLHGGVDAGTTAVITIPAELVAEPRRGGPATDPGPLTGAPAPRRPSFAGNLPVANPNTPWFAGGGDEAPGRAAQDTDVEAAPGALPKRTPTAGGETTRRTATPAGGLPTATRNGTATPPGGTPRPQRGTATPPGGVPRAGKAGAATPAGGVPHAPAQPKQGASATSSHGVAQATGAKQATRPATGTPAGGVPRVQRQATNGTATPPGGTPQATRTTTPAGGIPQAGRPATPPSGVPQAGRTSTPPGGIPQAGRTATPPAGVPRAGTGGTAGRAGGTGTPPPGRHTIPGAGQPPQADQGTEEATTVNGFEAPQRSPEEIRARLSGFQQGLRRARRPEPAEDDRSGARGER